MFVLRGAGYLDEKKINHSTWTEHGIGRVNVRPRPGPAPPGQGSSAVSAVRCRTSLHVSFGLGQETWNRISSNASFLQRVFYTKLNRRGSTSFVWNSGKKPAGSSTWTSELKEAAARTLSRALQAPFPRTRDTARTALTMKICRHTNCRNVTPSYLHSECSRHKSTCTRQAYSSNNGVTQ